MKTKESPLEKLRLWGIIWGMGLAGQLCWNMENQWFNTFVYAKISGDVNIVTAMVIVSAFVAAMATFVFGTLSDRLGKRKFLVSLGYVIWGICTILFGLTEYARTSGLGALVALSGFLVVFSDAVMTLFGSMGSDAGYNAWVNDHTDETNQGQVGAALAVLPVIATVVGTVLGGILINIGNPTVGTEVYDPSQDNYQLLFWVMGSFVIVMGLASVFFMKDRETLRPHREGTFLRQLFSVFQWRVLKRNPHLKELLLACAVTVTFFIPFNFYFTHLGNWLIYDINMTAAHMGLVEGIGLLLASLVTIPMSRLINRNRLPLVVRIAVITNALGLFGLYTFVKTPEDVNVLALLSAENVPLFVSVFLMGTGYVLIAQSCMIWVRGLFPAESRGQFEGIRSVSFTLIPMLIGTLIGNAIIKNTPQTDVRYDVYGHVIDVPQENLFLVAGFLVLLTLIPLYFAGKEYRKRIS